MSVVQNDTELSLTNLTPKPKELMSSVGHAKVSGLVANEIKREDTVSDEGKKVSQEPITAQQLEKVAQQLQDFVGEMNHGLEFSVDKDSGRDVIKVIDKDSGDLVKQFPSEEVLTLVAKLSEMVGGFIDAKV